MWERFSFYGMRAILVLFLTRRRRRQRRPGPAPRARATPSYGVYNAMVYLMALPGGWIADRLLGARRAVLVGGIVIMLRPLRDGVPHRPDASSLGLALIVVGTGLLKPNISHDGRRALRRGGRRPRRDAGFSIFYMGINLGAFLAPLVTGYLGEEVAGTSASAPPRSAWPSAVIQYVLGGRSAAAGVGARRPSPLTAAERRSVLARPRHRGRRGRRCWSLIARRRLGRAHHRRVVNIALTVVAIVVGRSFYFACMLLAATPSPPASGPGCRAYVWLFASPPRCSG